MVVKYYFNCIKKKENIFIANNPNFNFGQFPFNCNKDILIQECKKIIINEKKGAVEIPSFLRIFKAIKMGVVNEGIEKVMHPNSNK
jgi:hypothetical protein